MKKNLYPLLSDAFNKKDIIEAIKVIKSKNITMSKKTEMFEKYFAKIIGSKYAVMTNSGSSANLISMSCLRNPLSPNRIPYGSEVIIPAVCWSTTLWPILQNNLKPVFVDVELNTFNIDLESLKKKIKKKTKAIIIVHVLGSSTNMNELMKIVRKHKLNLIEDTCESLGAEYNKKKLGTYGRFGTYSFYYSHQITSGEGGMVVCNNYTDYNILKSLRSHGWSRKTIFQKIFKRKYDKLDDRFLFIGPGYNLRPTEIQSVIAHNQFKRLKKFMSIRNFNRNKIITSLKKNKKWDKQFQFVKLSKSIKPSWFGLPIMVSKKYSNIKNKFLKKLSSNGIENRPIISGNFLNQPASKMLKLKYNKNDFKNSNEIEERGFFIGLHTKKITNSQLKNITNNFLKIDDLL